MLSKLLGVFSLFLICVLSEGPDFNYYHTTASLKQNVIDLSNKCNGFLKIEKILNDPELELISIKDPQQNNTKKAFFIFGEHAREMISPETGLLFLKQICTSKSQILERYEIQIVLNANPSSRARVEKGEYCLRVNENGVDLNRNWDSHWVKNDGDGLAQTNPGETPFSEPETIALKSALDNYRPFLFLTIHSGTMGMYTPYAYSDQKAVYNEKNMLNVLSQINSKHCSCRNGAAGKEVGYLCPGTCLDYAYDSLKVPYVFAWEIYDQNFDFSRFQTSQSRSFLQLNEKIKKGKKSKKFMEAASCFLQVQSKFSFELSDLECFEFFNPTSQIGYHQVTENWAQALFDLLEIVHSIEVEQEKKNIHFRSKEK